MALPRWDRRRPGCSQGRGVSTRSPMPRPLRRGPSPVDPPGPGRAKRRRCQKTPFNVCASASASPVRPCDTRSRIRCGVSTLVGDELPQVLAVELRVAGQAEDSIGGVEPLHARQGNLRRSGRWGCASGPATSRADASAIGWGGAREALQGLEQGSRIDGAWRREPACPRRSTGRSPRPNPGPSWRRWGERPGCPWVRIRSVAW